MLETLHIRDYALIDECEVEFGPGFDVLTGETGAGKSIIVGALNLVLGGRASGDAVRDGAGRATVEAVFRIPKPSARLTAILRQHEIALEEGALLVSRVVTAEGRSRAYAGGALVPVSVLEEIGDELVDLHGQHEHQSLLRSDRQLGLLDAFGELEDDAARVAGLVADLRQAEKDLASLEQDDRERERRLEFLRFETAEIAAASLQPGEEEEVRARRNLITNAEKIVALASQAYGALYEAEGGAAVEMIGAALKDLEELVPVEDRFRQLADRLETIQSDIEELASEVRAFTDRIEFDPAELESLNQRLALIGTLKRKYGESIEAILAYYDRASAEIARFDQRDQLLAETRAKRAQLETAATDAARELSRKRQAAARRLDKQVTAALQELGMKGGAFETQFETGGLTQDGIDRIAFLLTANPGEKPKPLRQVASGGEISRVMLAIKTVFAHADKIPTLVFDEIDAGVGGAVATKVAARLRQLAKSHQTICITHIAQIAAAADHHYHVSKSTAKGRTKTAVARVDAAARVEELARLLDGSVSDLSLAHARDLLQKQ